MTLPRPPLFLSGGCKCQKLCLRIPNLGQNKGKSEKGGELVKKTSTFGAIVIGMKDATGNDTLQNQSALRIDPELKSWLTRMVLLLILTLGRYHSSCGRRMLVLGNPRRVNIHIGARVLLGRDRRLL